MTPHQQAVIFDWNGTIPDDGALLCQSTNQVLALFDVEPLSVERYREVYDIPVNNTYKMLGCTDEKMKLYAHEMVEVWREHYETHVGTVPLRDGAAQALRDIKADGHRVAVLSNYVRDSISTQALRYDIHHCFDAILAHEYDELKNVMHKRGKGERLRDFIKTYDIRDAIIVGDSPEEAEIARDYGFKSIIMSGGCCSEKLLQAARADYYVPSLRDVPPIVRRVFGSGRGK